MEQYQQDINELLAGYKVFGQSEFFGIEHKWYVLNETEGILFMNFPCSFLIQSVPLPLGDKPYREKLEAATLLFRSSFEEKNFGKLLDELKKQLPLYPV